MEHTVPLVQKMTDTEAERLCCSHDFIKQEVPEGVVQVKPNSGSDVETIYIKQETPDAELEAITVKDEPIYWKQEPQASSGPGFHAVTFKREVDDVAAEASSWQAEAKDNSMEGSCGAYHTRTLHQGPARASQGSVDSLPSDVSGSGSGVEATPPDRLVSQPLLFGQSDNSAVAVKQPCKMDDDTSVSQIEDFITVSEMTLLGESVEQSRKKRKMECASNLDHCDDQVIANNLAKEMRLEDADSYRNLLRMSTSIFSWLLERVTPIIQKKGSNVRSSITAHDRLAVTLRYLATGESRSSLHFQFRMGRTTISGILTEVCKALTHVLASYISVPSKTEEWLQVATQFWQLWNFPSCLGAIDGKHVAILPPSHNGSQFINYKGSYSVVLFALVDADLKFLYVDVGTNGQISDGGVYAKSRLKDHIDSNTLKMPERANLPGTNTNVPFTILADDAFPLTERLMKPYPQEELTKKQRIFNYRLSRARRVVENALGILASRFQVFRQPIKTTVRNVNQIVLATCSLHNLLLKTDKNQYTPIGFTDSEDVVETTVKLGDWRNSANGFLSLESECQQPSQEALRIRNQLCDYFNGRGSVSWQDDMSSK